MTTLNLTPEKLDEIEARADAATEGPWKVDEYEALDVWSPAGLVSSAAPVKTDERKPEADAEFVAHARSDVPALVAEVRRLRSLGADLARLMSEWSEGRPTVKRTLADRLNETRDVLARAADLVPPTA